MSWPSNGRMLQETGTSSLTSPWTALANHSKASPSARGLSIPPALGHRPSATRRDPMPCRTLSIAWRRHKRCPALAPVAAGTYCPMPTTVAQHAAVDVAALVRPAPGSGHHHGHVAGCRGFGVQPATACRHPAMGGSHSRCSGVNTHSVDLSCEQWIAHSMFAGRPPQDEPTG